MKIVIKSTKQAIVPLIAVCLVSCSHHTVMDTLRDVDSFIQERPDSALAVLESIDTESLVFKKENALYSLLHTMALDKSLVEIKDTTLIEPAINYYKWHKKENRYAASLFYLGRIFYNSTNYSEAMLQYQEALEETSSIYWRGMITSDMSFVANKSYNIDDELKYARQSLSYWKEWGDSTHIDQAMLDYAIACNNSKHIQLADSLLGVLCTRTKVIPGAYAIRAVLSIKRKNPDYRSIVEWFDLAKRNGYLFSVTDWYQYSYALWKIGETDRAESIIAQLSAYADSLPASIWLGKLAADKEDFQEAYRYQKNIVTLSDTLVRKQLEQSVFKAQTAHYRQLLKREQDRSKNQIVFALFVIITIILLGLIVFLFYKNKSRILAEENERISRIAEDSSRLLETAINENKVSEAVRLNTERTLFNLRADYVKLYQSQFIEISKMLDYCFKGNKISAASKRYVEKVEKILQEITGNANEQKKFEARINKDLENIMFYIRQDFPNFKESDFRLLSYLIVGFDATTCSILMDETLNNIRVRKFRLKKRIMESTSDHKDLYRCFLYPKL